MAARAIWKGELKVSSTRVPVKLYSAVQDHTVRFHILEEKSKTRVKQHMVAAESGKEIPHEEIQKGFEVEPGTFVILDAEELAKLEPKASREIEITQFLPPSQIPPEYFDRPYYLGPDGDQAAYFAFAEALQKKEREGVARWVMRKQVYVGAVRAVDDYLMLFTLRNAEEVLSAKDLPKPSGRAPDSMLKLGQALIASGQKREGCTALAALKEKYPKAPPAVLAQGSDARKAVCRGIS